MMELSKNHLQIMKDIGEGATIWGFMEAHLLREVQAFDPSFVKLVPLDELEQYDPSIAGLTGADQLPYFGAVLTSDGFAYLDRNKNKLSEEGDSDE